MRTSRALRSGGHCELPASNVPVNGAGVFEAKPLVRIPDVDGLPFFEMHVMNGVRSTGHYIAGMLKEDWRWVHSF